MFNISNTNIIHSNLGNQISWVSLFAASLFIFYEHVLLSSMNTLSSSIIDELNISRATLGVISSSYFWGNLIALLFAGSIIDRYSVKKCILFATCCSIIGIWLFSFAQSSMLLFLSRFFIGLTAGFSLLGAFKIASQWFQAEQMAFVTGIIVLLAIAGGGVSQFPAQIIVNLVGWRLTSMIIGIFGLFLVLIMWLFIKEKKLQTNNNVPYQLMEGIKRVLQNQQNWLGSFYAALLNLPIFLLGSLWGNLYLVETKKITLTNASIVSSMIFVGAIVSAPLIGKVSDKIKKRRLPMLFGGIASLVTLVFALTINHYSILLLLFFILGVCTSFQTVAYAFVSESNPKLLTATAISMISFLSIGLAGITQILFGYIVDFSVLQMEMPISQGYQMGAYIILAAFLCALILSYFMKETHCKQTYTF